jgi:predicted SPOUT superfamily RNA methylase MTH1
VAGPLEKDTCRDYVLPLLKAAHWTEDQIQEQFPITDGRVITVGKKHAGLLTLRQLRTRAEAVDVKAVLRIERAIHLLQAP